MKKIPSLFQRNYDGDRLGRDEIVPGSEWVVAGEGIATRKFDGTACLIYEGHLFKRYDAKAGKTPPNGFNPAQPAPDPISGHWPGWILIGGGAEDRWHREAWDPPSDFTDWTYELVGPKIQGNPEGYDRHRLVQHGSFRWSLIEDGSGDAVPRTFALLKKFISDMGIEGIVWWREPDDVACEKVKIKAKDFGLPWPRTQAVR